MQPDGVIVRRATPRIVTSMLATAEMSGQFAANRAHSDAARFAAGLADQRDSMGAA